MKVEGAPGVATTIIGHVHVQPSGNVEITGAGVQFDGGFMNEGTVHTFGADVGYRGTFTNARAYISDPSTQTFLDLVVTPTGYLMAGAGDVFAIQREFRNDSRENTRWDTHGASLLFAGQDEHVFRLAGKDRGNGRDAEVEKR